MRYKITLTTILLAITLSTQLLSVSLFEHIGSPGDVNPLNARYSHTGFSSPYFNPSLMVLGKKQKGISFILLKNDLDIKLKARPDGTDISEEVYDARKRNSDGTTEPLTFPAQATSDLKNKRGVSQPEPLLSYLVIGFTDAYLDDKLFIGFTAVIPVGSFMEQSPFFPDEREQYFSNSLQFELYGDRFTNSSFSFGAAYYFSKLVSVGFGVDMAISTRANSEIFISDISVAEVENMKAATKVTTGVAPKFAITITPFDDFFLTAAVKLPFYSDIETNTTMIFLKYEDENGDNIQYQNINFRYNYEPLKASFGGAWKTGGLKIVGGLDYNQWSSYYNRFREQPVFNWLDTISFSLGLSYDMQKRSFGMDLAYIPSPVPDQVGFENYVDNDRISVSLNWSENFNIKSTELIIAFNLLASYLFERDTTKRLDVKNAVFDEFPDSVDIKDGEIINSSLGFQTNNPGYPGYSSSGISYSAGLTLILNY